MRVGDYIRPSGLADLRIATAIRVHVEMVLEYTEGDLRWAAEELDVDGSTLWRWRKKWGDEKKEAKMNGPGIIDHRDEERAERRERDEALERAREQARKEASSCTGSE